MGNISASQIIELENRETTVQRCFMLLLVAGCITILESSIYVTV